jgi:AcrR family transcriptional regulator
VIAFSHDAELDEAFGGGDDGLFGRTRPPPKQSLRFRARRAPRAVEQRDQRPQLGVLAGYDSAGVRDIAKGAGVTAMLVNRYFGSKEQLFGEVVADIMSRPIILTGDRLKSANGGKEMAEALVALTAAGAPLEGFQIMCRSAASPRAAEIGRAQIEAHYHKALTAALPGAHAAERAALLLAFVAGVQIMRQMIGVSALATCSPAVLMKILGPAFQHLWAGDSARTKRSRK